jgi:hypothetical protein
MRLIVVAWLCVAPVAPQGHTGYAAQHTKLARVARARGMDPTGHLFASPLAPLGARLCVSSAVMPDPVCGRIVDIPQPHHRKWQLREGRIIEVDPQLAGRLCEDPAGPPRSCPVTLWRK